MASTVTTSTALAQRLSARTLELVDIRSESRSERDIAAHVLRVLGEGGVPARDAGEECVLAGVTARARRPFVLLVGHLDTVPAQGNWPGRCTGERVEGLGASDMKAGVAVMLELALALAHVQAAVDVGYVFVSREEVPSAEGALVPLLERERGLRSADLAVVLEPTANTVQAGCLGNLDAAWTFRGRAGHSARPWLAENAIDHAADGVLALRAIGPSERVLDGLSFTQVVSVTGLHAGLARNVIPATATATVNFRYTPDQDELQAERALRAWCEPHGELEVLANTPGARAPRDNPLLSSLIRVSGAPARSKQAWTPVAELTAAGVPAVNLGPGDPALAHSPDEHVTTALLVGAYEILKGFLCA